MLYLKLAWRNIWRNKRRTFITMVSIVMAVVLASVMAALQQGQYNQMIDNTVGSFSGHIQVQALGYLDEPTLENSLEIDTSLFHRISENQDILAIVPRIESFALAAGLQKTKAGMVIGIDVTAEQNLSKPNEKIIEGSYFTSNTDPGALVAAGLADYLKLSVGDTLVLLSQGYQGLSAAGLFPVTGILKFGIPQMNNSILYLPLETAQQFYGISGRLTSIALLTENPKKTDQIVSKIEKNLDPNLAVLGWQTLMPELVQAIQADWGSGLIVLMVLYMVVGFGILGTVLMMTAERRFEFGVMMAVGTSRARMAVMIILEMLFIISLGTLLGFMISIPIIYYFNLNPIYFTGEMATVIEEYGMEPFIRFSTDPMVLYIQAEIVFVIALLISLYPLLYMKRMEPVKAMRR